MFEEFFAGFLFFSDFVRRSNGWAKAVAHMIRLNTKLEKVSITIHCMAD
jgi:hypothetical protein